MAEVHIIRHKPSAVFCGTAEVIILEEDRRVVRLVEPSGNVGTQYPYDVGSQWFGTIQNLNAGLALSGARWSDVYKTDVLWTTPGFDRAACDARKDAFNGVYAPMLAAAAGGPLNSNRMARFTHQEGFPDAKALFEVQVKGALGADVRVGGGKVAYGTWTDHQPSGASVLHRQGDQVISTLGPDLAQETRFILVEQLGKRLASEGVDLKTQTVWLETLVAIDDAPEKAWERVSIVKGVIAEYFGKERPAGLVYLVSRLPNLDGIVEIQPRLVSGQVEIVRSGRLEYEHSTWVAVRRPGVTEVLVGATTGKDAGFILDTLDARVREAGGHGLKADGIFNNAYIVAASDSTTNRAMLAQFNQSFAKYYEGMAPAARTAQFVGGFVRPGAPFGMTTRAIFATR